MEEFKELNEILQMDEKHSLFNQVTGQCIKIEEYYLALAKTELSQPVPEAIRGQFNVARNMAIYTYFLYALAPEVHLKIYTVLEHALRLRASSKQDKPFKKLLRQAVSEGWIKDSGFRHISEPEEDDPYSNNLIEILPKMRNDLAHGSALLVPDCIGHIEKCCDIINQLFYKVTEHNNQFKKENGDAISY